MRYYFKVHKEDSGYWAECPELDGCMTQADSMDELQLNMEEALNLYLTEYDEDAHLAPLPKERKRVPKGLVPVKVSPSVALAYGYTI